MSNFQDIGQDIPMIPPLLSKCNSFIYQSNYDDESEPYWQSQQRKIDYQRSRSPSRSPPWRLLNYNYFEESQQLIEEQNEFMKLFESNIKKRDDVINESPPFIQESESPYFNDLELKPLKINLLEDQRCLNKNVFQVQKKISRRFQVSKKVFEGKNCCKNIILNSLRTIENPQYFHIIHAICLKFGFQTTSFIQYYSDAILQLTGFRAVRKELIFTGDTETEENKRKAVFRMYLNWYLKEIAVVHILRGKASDKNKKLYIEYKNKVLLKYINYPENWLSDQLPSNPP